MIPEAFIVVSPILSLIGGYAYVRDTLRGSTKPNRVSFFIWALAPLIGVMISLGQGAGISVVPVFMAGLVPLIIFCTSFVNKKAYWKLGVLDYICGLFSILSLILWLVVKEPVLALTFAILADLLAFLPTFVKAWGNPETETSSLYILSTLGNIVGLLTIKNWVFTSYGFSLYLIIGNMICVLLIYRKRLFPVQKLSPI